MTQAAECAENPVVVQPTPEQVEEQLAKRVFFTVTGGSLPLQTDLHGPPLVCKPEDRVGGNRYYLPMLPEIPEPADDLPPRYPRKAAIPVEHMLAIGTIDELVELYRTRLTQAARLLVEFTAAGPVLSVEKSQQNARQLGYDPGRGGLQRPLLDVSDQPVADWYQRVGEHLQRLSQDGLPETDWYDQKKAS